MGDDFEALRREATALIVRVTSGAATTDDADALARWRALSPDHELAFRETARLWKNLGPALRQDAGHGPMVISRRGLLVGTGLAAGIAGIGVSLSELGYLPSFDALLSEHATAIGEQRRITLPDGSAVTLDGGSALSHAYSPASRQLRLLAGSAVFDVMPDDRRPFVLLAGEGRATTAAASFAAAHGAGSVSVECLAGRLSVECRGVADLVEGEGIRYSAGGLGTRSVVDLEIAASWRKGLLIFNDRPLEDVVADLNRHRRGKVVIARDALRARHVSGVFHLNRPQEILAHLQQTLSLRSVSLGSIVLLL